MYMINAQQYQSPEMDSRIPANNELCSTWVSGLQDVTSYKQFWTSDILSNIARCATHKVPFFDVPPPGRQTYHIGLKAAP